MVDPSVWTQRAERFRENMTNELCASLAEDLGVTPSALDQLEVGWCPKRAAYTFPEKNDRGEIIGISLRRRDHSKSAVRGSKRGLLLPRDHRIANGSLLALEGASDVAAALSLGLNAIGRPSAKSGAELLAQLPEEMELLIVGDNDPKPDGQCPGRSGAIVTATHRANRIGRTVRYTFPPGGQQDLRSWLNAQDVDLSDQAAREDLGQTLLDALEDAAEDVAPVVGTVPRQSTGGRALLGEQFPVAAAESLETGIPIPVYNRHYPYSSTSQGIILERKTRDGPVDEILTNFSARIISEVIHDDGETNRNGLEIEACLEGRKPVRVCLSAPKFIAMTWPIEYLGASAIVYPGFATRDHARAAIQLLSTDIARTTVFEHCGWRKEKDRWIYLHGAGAIGDPKFASDVNTELPDALAPFRLPQPPEGERLPRAILASLALFELGTPLIGAALLGAIYRSVLGPCDFAVSLVGATGTFKTEVAALCQQHFGVGFDARNLPGSWTSTANYLEGLAYAAKDALLVVDDFSPQGTTSDISKTHRDAERLLRAQGNRAGRGRMRSDQSLRHTKRPRGLILSTGEDIPRGHSLRSRVLFVEVQKGDVPSTELSIAQGHAADGLFADAMSGFLRWVADRLPILQAEMSDKVHASRTTATDGAGHRRTPETVVQLAFGFELFLRYATASGAIDAETQDEKLRLARNAFEHLAAAQNLNLRDADPVARFLDLLQSALLSGRAHVASLDGRAPDIRDALRLGWEATDERGHNLRPRGLMIGWVDPKLGALLLDGPAAYRAAQDVAGPSGEGISLSEKRLWKAVQQRGLLVVHETGRQTVRRVINGSRQRVYALRCAELPCETPGHAGHLDQFAVLATANDGDGPVRGPVGTPVEARSGPQRGPLARKERGIGPDGPHGPVPETGGSNSALSIPRPTKGTAERKPDDDWSDPL